MDHVIPSLRRLRHQAWGMSIGLHALFGVLLMFVQADLRSTIPPEPFRWQVSLLEPPAPKPEPDPAVPSNPATQAPSQATPPARQSAMPVDARPVRRAVAQVRETQPRTPPTIESRVVNRVTPMERPLAVESVAAVVHSKAGIQQRESTVQERSSGEVGAVQTVVQPVAQLIETEGTIDRSEGLVERSTGDEPVITQELIDTATGSIQRQVSAHERLLPVEVTQADHVELKQVEPVVSAAQSIGQVRPHYGWLKADLMDHIQRLKRYPQIALDNKWEGRVVVRAIITADGHLLDLHVVESSGHEALDRESLELLRRLSPVPLKHSLGAPQVTLRIPVNYGIR